MVTAQIRYAQIEDQRIKPTIVNNIITINIKYYNNYTNNFSSVANDVFSSTVTSITLPVCLFTYSR